MYKKRFVIVWFRIVCFDVADTIEKSLELPLDSEQATKFLDEHDLHDVLNKLPDDAFDIFTGELMTGKHATMGNL